MSASLILFKALSKKKKETDLQGFLNDQLLLLLLDFNLITVALVDV